MVARACARIAGSGGAVDIASLVAAGGSSHRHFIALFRDQVGLTPKRFARLARFEALLTALRAGPTSRPAWAELAAALGYADQSHLNRDVRRFAGVTPSRLPALLEPFGEG